VFPGQLSQARALRVNTVISVTRALGISGARAAAWAWLWLWLWARVVVAGHGWRGGVTADMAEVASWVRGWSGPGCGR
jgi:hypothetical protein